MDKRLRWEPSRFGNQTYIVVPATDVWLPDIAFRNRYFLWSDCCWQRPARHIIGHFTDDLPTQYPVTSLVQNPVWKTTKLHKTKLIRVNLGLNVVYRFTLSSKKWTELFLKLAGLSRVCNTRHMFMWCVLTHIERYSYSDDKFCLQCWGSLRRHFGHH